jgi:DNA processing protein
MASAAEEYSALFCLHRVDGVGSKTLWKLKESFGSFREALEAGEKRLKAAGVADKTISALSLAGDKDRDYYGEYAQQDIHAVLFDDLLYPPALKMIYDPPFLLYYRGDLAIHQTPACSVVGTRKPSGYGRTQAKRFAAELAQGGLTVVSGMAKGIDGEAHRGALEVSGRTTAVWGSGLNHVYPREHQKLAEDIAQRGLILSEFPPDYPPEPGFFPIRNRIISGLSQGVLIVEAQAKSGALITADLALEQGRDVYALPGPVSNQASEGPNRLIQQGAKLVQTPQDILEDYGVACRGAYSEPEKAPSAVQEAEHAALLNFLRAGPLHIDELFRLAGLSYGDLTVLLLELEFQGLVSRQTGNYYTLS